MIIQSQLSIFSGPANQGTNSQHRAFYTVSLIINIFGNSVDPRGKSSSYLHLPLAHSSLPQPNSPRVGKGTMATLGPRRDDHLTEVLDVMDVSTINRLLQEVVQSQRTLHRELFDTVVRKEQIGERLASHQVRPTFRTRLLEQHKLRCLRFPFVQRSVPVLGSVQAASSHLHSDILEMSALANVVSDQVKNALHTALSRVCEKKCSSVVASRCGNWTRNATAFKPRSQRSCST